MRRFATTAIFVLLAFAGALALMSGDARAATGRSYLSRLTEAPKGTPFAEPEGVAVTKAGDVFVLDAHGGGIDVFNSSGAFVKKFATGVFEEARGISVDESTGNVYVADSAAGVIDVFKPDGSGGYTLLSQWTGANTPSAVFEEASGVAVNGSTGAVYVADESRGVVYIFKAKPKGPEEAGEGEFVSFLGASKIEEPTGLTLNRTTGQVYIAELEDVQVYSSAGVFERKITGKTTPTKEFGEVTGVAVEEASGDVLISDGATRVVDEFSEAGVWVGWLINANGAPFGEPRGLGVDASTNHVYVVDPFAIDAKTKAQSPGVDAFSAPVVVPDAKTGKAPKKFEREAGLGTLGTSLSGTVNPLGQEASYQFEYATVEEFEDSEKFTFSTSLASAGSGSAEAKVSALVKGLKAETLYYYRLVATNVNGASYGATLEMQAPEAVSDVSSGAASNIQPTSATLLGSLAPEGFLTKYHFDYGETTAYGKASPVPDAETSSSSAISAETGLTGLTPNTTYHFRLSASNEFGTTTGLDAKFTTSGPPRITNVPTELNGHTGATIKAEINPDQIETTYHFEYGETTAYGTTVPIPDANIGSGATPVAVSAVLSGLKRATTYHFRVVASNTAGTTTGPDQQFTTALIEGQSVKEVTSSAATLVAQINPFGAETTYHFEYGTSTAYGTSTPIPDGDLGSGSEVKTVTAPLTGLAPNTTYHFRVVATVEGQVADGPDGTFTTQPASTTFKLPDNRAYELVSPPNKSGGYIEPMTASGSVIQSAEDGNGFAYVVNGPIVEDPEGNRSPEAQQVIATRSPAIWSSQQIVSPHERPWGLRPGTFPEYEAFSSNLALALLQPFPYGLTPLAEPPLAPPLSEAERGHQEKTLYLRSNEPIAPAASQSSIYAEAKQNGETLAGEHGTAAEPGYLPLVTAANVAPGTKFGGTPNETTGVQPALTFVSVTPDLSHVVISSKASLAPQAPSKPGLYEWAAGKLQLASVLPGGAAVEVPSTASLGYGPGQLQPNYRRALSDDGARITFTSWTTSPGLGHIYQRDMTRKETIQLDTPEAGITEAAQGAAQFQIASTDGSKVFFTDVQRLTSDSTARPKEAGQPARPDLYECEIVESEGKRHCELTDLTVAQNAGESAAVQGYVLGAAEDGSSIYLVATGALASGAQSGAFNLYRLHDTGSGWTTTFVARLSSEDSPSWAVRNRPDQPVLNSLTARVSPNGNFLAFMSNRSLTGYDNTDVNEETGKHADEEVFLYDAGANATKCVSCNPTGARPRGVFDTEFAGEGIGLLVDRPGTWKAEIGEVAPVAHWLAGSIPGWTPISVTTALYQSRYLSDSGRLFFNAADALSPDVAVPTRKEKIGEGEPSVGVENVYQYEPNGVGGCATAGGCVSLISSGKSSKESAFLDASVSGDDVFLLTAPALVSQDNDSSYDVYDARVCTEASPCQSESTPPPPPCETTDTCRSGGTSTPGFQPPPSSAPASGNAATPAKTQTLPIKTTKPVLTRKQRLAKALKACRKLPNKTKAQKKKRATCEAQAKKKYGAKKAKKSHKSSKPTKRASR